MNAIKMIANVTGLAAVAAVLSFVPGLTAAPPTTGGDTSTVYVSTRCSASLTNSSVAQCLLMNVPAGKRLIVEHANVQCMSNVLSGDPPVMQSATIWNNSVNAVMPLVSPGYSPIAPEKHWQGAVNGPIYFTPGDVIFYASRNLYPIASNAGCAATIHGRLVSQ